MLNGRTCRGEIKEVKLCFFVYLKGTIHIKEAASLFICRKIKVPPEDERKMLLMDTKT